MTSGLAVLFGYLLGSIPFGVILTRLAGHGDIRDLGSGNIGATNVLRTGSKPLALAVLLLDAAKGAGAVLTVFWWAGWEPAMLAGVAALTGHLFPIWLRLGNTRDLTRASAVLGIVSVGFALMIVAPDLQWAGAAILALAALGAWGGKGFATGLAVLAALVWPLGLVAGLVWLATAVVSRRSSVAALTALLAASGYAFLFEPWSAGFSALVTALVFVRHRENLGRLRRGTEPRFGDSPAESANTRENQ